MRLILALLMAVGPAFAACIPGVQAGSNPSVTAVCNVSYSAHSNPIDGEDQRVYDLYYLTSAGLHNTSPDYVYIHVRGYVISAARAEGSRTIIPDFIFLAQKGYNVFVPSYSLVGVIQLSSALGLNDAAIQFGVPDNGFSPFSPGFAITVDSEVMTVTAVSHGTWSVSRPSPQTHAKGAFGFIPSTQWPLQGQDTTAFLSVLAQCSAGGATPGRGDCASYTDVPGNPSDIRLWGTSAGADLALRVLMYGPSLLNRTKTTDCQLSSKPGTCGYPEWSNTGWHLRNVTANSPPANEAAVFNSAPRQDFSYYSAIAVCGCVPACISGFDPAAQTCAHPTECYTACAAKGPAAHISASNPAMPVLIQTGTKDADITGISRVFGNTAPHTTLHVYEGLLHGVDLLSNDPVNAQSFREMFKFSPAGDKLETGDVHE